MKKVKVTDILQYWIWLFALIVLLILLWSAGPPAVIEVVIRTVVTLTVIGTWVAIPLLFTWGWNKYIATEDDEENS